MNTSRASKRNVTDAQMYRHSSCGIILLLEVRDMKQFHEIDHGQNPSKRKLLYFALAEDSRYLLSHSTVLWKEESLRRLFMSRTIPRLQQHKLGQDLRLDGDLLTVSPLGILKSMYRICKETSL